MDLAAIKRTTDRNQAKASDPLASAWVSANAGTGKTYVLVHRVLRLLLSGTRAERILCLTFTKAAASEMANRLLEELARWAVITDEDLSSSLEKLMVHVPDRETLSYARRLFAQALETPGGLKIQTIHAFCERLLQRFPLEAGVAPHFSVLDSEEETRLRRAAIEQVLTRATSATEGALVEALKTVIANAGEDRFDELLRLALTDRDRLRDALEAVVADKDRLDALEGALCKTLGVRANVSEAGLLEEMAAVLDDQYLHEAAALLAAGKRSDQAFAAHLTAARNAKTVRHRAEALIAAFLTKEHAPRKRLVTKGLQEAQPDVANRLASAQTVIHGLTQEFSALLLARSSAAFVRLAEAVLRNYRDEKAKRSALDFDDLISRTFDLLDKSQAAAWILYKLDGGIDHILIDEAQDTSPKAWDVVEYLADEFFSGESARNVARTVFAVGDEKQSIYGFQGAAPEKFADMGERFSRKSVHAGRNWHRVPLTLSFRSTSAVLDAVDRVFAGPEALSGIDVLGNPVEHYAFRQGQFGLVEIWDTETAQNEMGGDPWSPLDDRAADEPAVVLANRIARKIAYWLENKTILESRGTPIEPGDITILVRKREPFAVPMIRALKARGIPVAGSDRIKIADQLAVKDLIVLGEFLLMPEDDLALATVLKSPLFDLTDEDLFEIGYGRRGLFWDALKAKAAESESFAAAAGWLSKWLARADLTPPYEFYAGVLLAGERRERMIARLGPEAGDAIDEFLNMALRFDDMEPPSLQGFLGWIRNSGTEIKRDMEQGRNEVRVMTIHGAKGLEANIVFLPDTCGKAGAGRGEALLPLGNDTGERDRDDHLLWTIAASRNVAQIENARQQKRLSERQEYHRLLYVAMTRARDRLYLGGFEGKSGREAGCWYDLARERLNPILKPATDELGAVVWRHGSPQTAEPDKGTRGLNRTDWAETLPDWALARAPKEPVRTMPVSPSTLIPLDPDEAEAEETAGQTAISPRRLATESRFLRGRLTHSLLEHLPKIAPEERHAAAWRFMSERAGDLVQPIQESIVSETLDILGDPQFAPLFGPESRAEVPIIAQIAADGEKDAAPILISGQIDRLVIGEDGIQILDYKTNRPPPTAPEDVAPAYLVQLAAYRAAIALAYPGKPVSCAILWTDGPALMPIPEDLLEAYRNELVRGRRSRT